MELTAWVPGVQFAPIWVETIGDRDLATSLRSMDKSDFFTREIDALQLEGGCRIAVHSAKDLPEPLDERLAIVALTRGVDPSDVLVLREGERLEALRAGARIGCSSSRREETILTLRSDLTCVDIRGPIHRRLALLQEGQVDGVVMANAALIRLRIHANAHRLPGHTAPLQGQLAVVARASDQSMRELFACIDVRRR